MAKIEVKIGSIGNANDITVRSGIESLDILSQSSSDASNINYGILASTGSISILDKNSEIENGIKRGTISSSRVPFSISINEKEIIGSISTDSSFSSHEKKFSVNLSNQLQSWDDIEYPGFAYPYKSMTAYSLLLSVLKSVGYSNKEIIQMLSLVADRLKSINIEYPFLNKASLRETIDKFCLIGQMSCYENEDGEVIFVSGRPIATDNDGIRPIRIPQYNLVGDIETDLFIKNKYNAVEISETVVEDNFTDEENDSSTVSQQITTDSSISSSMGLGLSNINTDPKVVTTMLYSYTNMTNASFIKVQNYYQEGVFYIENELNLDGLQSIDSTSYSLSYKTSESSDVGGRMYPQSSDSDLTLHTFSCTPSSDFQENTGKLKTSFSHTYSNATSTLEVEDESYINAYFMDGSLTVQYKILVGQEYVYMGGVLRSSLGETEYRLGTELSSNTGSKYVKSIAESFTVNIVGDKRTITTKTISVSDAISNNSVVAKVGTNELLQDKTTIGDEKISSVIKNNIKSDYLNGIATANVEIFCSDLYYEDGELAKNWKNGEILIVGDIVFFTGDLYADGNQRYWRITGRTFTYDGEPRLKLELQECKIMRLQNLSWADISRISRGGLAQEYFKIGDEKTFKLTDDEEVTVLIAGFNHDTIENSTNKAGITFEMKHLLADTYPLTETTTTMQDWKTTKMHTEIIPSLYERLPNDLKQYIRTVQKRCPSPYVSTDGNTYQGTETLNLNLWLFSDNEITGGGSLDKEDLDFQYEYHRHPTNELVGSFVNGKKALSNGAGEYSPWWLRTIMYQSGEYKYASIMANGSKSYNTVSTESKGICLGFCI